MVYLTGIGLTEEARTQFEKDAETRKLAIQCQRCHEYRDWMLNHSPTVKFMQQQINRIGGNLNRRNIICDNCDESKSGGFHPELGILICSNKIYSKWQLEDTLAHEMVHAYDQCKFNVDWSDLKHHACSEIRASALSGECRMMNQMFRAAKFNFSKGHQECVKRRATLSVRANPNCKSDLEAARVVNQVFDSCYFDTRPFDDIYR